MLLLLALLQAPAVQATQNPGPIARIAVEPSGRTVTAGDTVRLRGTALDSTGAPVPGARVFFFSAPSSRFEGRVDTAGLLRAGAPGTLPMTARAVVAGGTARTEQFEIQIVAGPAARITATPARLRLVAGQSVPVEVGAPGSSASARCSTSPRGWEDSAPRWRTAP